MERKFKLKLLPVKASEVRKQAIVHLKEQLNWYIYLFIIRHYKH